MILKPLCPALHLNLPGPIEGPGWVAQICWWLEQLQQASGGSPKESGKEWWCEHNTKTHTTGDPMDEADGMPTPLRLAQARREAL